MVPVRKPIVHPHWNVLLGDTVCAQVVSKAILLADAIQLHNTQNPHPALYLEVSFALLKVFSFVVM